MNSQLVIIGAGPAGLSAAVEAAGHGVKVTVIDENDQPGGQLFLQTHRFFGSRRHRAGIRGFQIAFDLLNEIKNYDIDMLLGTVVWGIYPDMRVAFAAEGKKKDFIFAQNILIATGALEKVICFKGWTKPGVMGAGAAQNMMHVNRVLPGSRALVVGSGNVGLIVSYQLAQAGIKVAGVIDVLPEPSGYQVHTGKILRLGIPIMTSHKIIEAKGESAVEAAVISKVDKNGKIIEGTRMELPVDLICLAVGLRPFNELCWAANLEMKYIRELGGFVPLHNEALETIYEGIYVAGDVSGIEEANTAMDEGRLVGIVVAKKLGLIKKRAAVAYKNEIKNSLQSLRVGKYGYKRADAKQEIIRSFKAIGK